MNTSIYYKFELYSRDEYYRKNKNVFDDFYNDEYVKKAYNAIVNKYTFIFWQSLASIYYIYFLYKNNFRLTNVGKVSLKILIFMIFNANLTLRSFNKEYPFDNSSERKQGKFLIFAKIFLNHNFCLTKDLYLILFLYNIKLSIPQNLF